MRHALGVLLLLLFGSANAALLDRGGGFIYDDVLDITWMQNAGLSGSDTWDNQVAWAASLSVYDSVRDSTWDDWRLATTDVNWSGAISLPADCAVVSEVECRSNELGYMFHHNGVNPLASFNYGPFNNLQFAYWSAQPLGEPGGANAWRYNFIEGSSFVYDKQDWEFHGWAVRDGDVAASIVPVPAALWLFGSGLCLLGWLRRAA